MKATHIKMKPGSYYSQSLLEIDEIYIDGNGVSGFFKKAIIYDYLKQYPGAIQVNIWPYPNLVPALSSQGEKYVRSSPNGSTHDNLLSLPRV